MNRRGFLLGLAGVVGAGATAGLALSSAEATPLDQLRNLSRRPEDGLQPGDVALDDAEIVDDAMEGGTPAVATLPDGRSYATAPDGTPIEEVARVRRRVRVCRTVRDRWGRRVRRCWYEWRWVWI